jgi:hypothetical protein
MPMRPSKTLGGNRLKAARCAGTCRACVSWRLPFTTNRARTSSAPAPFWTVPCEILAVPKIHSPISTSITCAPILRIGNDIFQPRFSIASAQSCLVSRGAMLLREPSGSYRSYANQEAGIFKLPDYPITKSLLNFTSGTPSASDPSPGFPGPRSSLRASSWLVRSLA